MAEKIFRAGIKREPGWLLYFDNGNIMRTRMARARKDELVYCVIGVPAQASIKNKSTIIDVAREAVDSVMLCSEPFAVAYGLDMLDDVLVIDIGAGTTDLCRMHGTMPEDSDQVTFNIAGDAVEGMLVTLPADFTQNAANADIVKAFQAKKRNAAGAFQMTAYTATQVIADGIKGAGTDDPTKVAKYLHANSFDTPIGKVSWNKQGDLTNFEFDVFVWHKDGSKTVYK